MEMDCLRKIEGKVAVMVNFIVNFTPCRIIWEDKANEALFLGLTSGHVFEGLSILYIVWEDPPMVGGSISWVWALDWTKVNRVSQAKHACHH